MKSETVTHRLVMSTIVLVLAGAVVVAAMLTSGPASSEVPENSPSPTMTANMPGMNHGSAEIPASSPPPKMAVDRAGMDHDSGEMLARSALQSTGRSTRVGRGIG